MKLWSASIEKNTLTLLCSVFSVLVHSGGVHGGHYYAFIRPILSDQWYVICMLITFLIFQNAKYSAGIVDFL